jgi:hypothetical protein
MDDEPYEWRHQLQVLHKSGRYTTLLNTERDDMTPQQSFKQFYDWFTTGDAPVFEQELDDGLMIFVRSEIELVTFKRYEDDDE